MTITNTCRICGGVVESRIPSDWHPSKLLRRAELDLQAHLRTHSFAEILRFEIRQDLGQVPDDQRPIIVRDIYRHLLGRQDGEHYALNDSDARGVYTIDEALGQLAMYRLWRSARMCGDPRCRQHG